MHHIIPKHMGGTDDPSNLIKLTIEEHALAHKKLWEEHGKVEDHIAYRMLSGQITVAEATKLIQKKPKSEEHKRKLRESNIAAKSTEEYKALASTRAKQQHANGPSGFSGHTHTLETRLKVGAAHKGKKITEETRQKLRETCGRPGPKNGMWGITRPRVLCPHCNRDVDPANASRWHFDKCKEKIDV